MPKAEPDEDPLYTPIRVFTHKTFKKNDIKNSDWHTSLSVLITLIN